MLVHIFRITVYMALLDYIQTKQQELARLKLATDTAEKILVDASRRGKQRVCLHIKYKKMKPRSGNSREQEVT